MLGFGRRRKYRKARGEGASKSQLVAMGYGMGLMSRRRKARGDGRRRKIGGYVSSQVNRALLPVIRPAINVLSKVPLLRSALSGYGRRASRRKYRR